MPQVTAPLFGILGSLRFIVAIEDEAQQEESDDFLYGYALERQKSIEREIRDAISETLGADYGMFALRLSQGSLNIDFYLTAVGTIYVTISQYDDFLKGLSRLTNQLTRKFELIFGGAAANPPDDDLSVKGSWQPAGALSEAHRFLMTPRSSDLNLLFTIYLMSSNAVLLALTIWLLVRHLK